MSTLSHSITTDPFHVIDRHVEGVVALDLKAADSSFGGAVAHLVQIYGAVRPLLTSLAAFVFIPPNWRSVVMTLVATLDAIVAGAGSAHPDFKAGKDL